MSTPEASFAVTISLGLTTAGDGTDRADLLIRTAAAALYRAKHAGRNRVEPGWPPAAAARGAP